jgi:hypothetical protein
LQPVIVWFWQLQWLLMCFVKFIDEDPMKASARGPLIAAYDAVVAAWAREGEQDFAGEVGSHENGRMTWDEPGKGWREEYDPHIGVAVSAVVMHEPGGRPCDSSGRNDRRATLSVN